MSTVALAQIIGPAVAAAGIGLLLHKKFYAKILKDFEQHEGLTYFAGIFITILGLIIVLNHNIWELSAAGIITFIGWASVVKGIAFLIVPQPLYRMSKGIINSTGLIRVASVIWVAAGGYLVYFGYFA
ncbi:MAG: hypothetical protein ABIH35_04910 [Patescibacteria group bacterium]